jgi:DNA helicase IV
VREGDAFPDVVTVSSTDELAGAVAAAIRAMTAERDDMSVVVVVPDDMADDVSSSLLAAGISHGRAAATGLDTQVTVVPISIAKGLEVDGVVVVEPARIVASEIQGLRALYVALTRPTQRLTIVHAEPLPEPLATGVDALADGDASRISA